MSQPYIPYDFREWILEKHRKEPYDERGLTFSELVELYMDKRQLLDRKLVSNGLRRRMLANYETLITEKILKVKHARTFLNGKKAE